MTEQFFPSENVSSSSVLRNLAGRQALDDVRIDPSRQLVVENPKQQVRLLRVIAEKSMALILKGKLRDFPLKLSG